MAGYCSKYGLDFYKSGIDYVNGQVKWVWNRGRAIKTVISQYDWIVWIDSDCLFMDFTKDIRSFIDDSYSLIIGENDNPPCWWKEPTHIECGVFFLKNDAVGNGILEKTFSEERMLADKQKSHPWHEQYSLICTIQNDKEIRSRVKMLNMDEINYHQYKLDSGKKNDNMFIYHCAGGERYSITDRVKLLQEKLKFVKSE
jgi:hypothetical protein